MITRVRKGTPLPTLPPLQPLFSTNTQVNECLKDQTHTNHLVTKKEFPSTISKHFQKTPTSILRNVVP